MKGRERKFTIGRSRDCDIVLADESVSRNHAELILLPDGKLFLIDCHSNNGTELLINGQACPIRQELVLPTDILKFGDVTITVKDMLEGIHMKFKALNIPAILSLHPETKPPQKTWAQGTRLVRCVCGTIKPKGQKCRECGK